ncbi:hypothetical protein [Pseudoduganella aquatica]|uniref:hypothetical protein n=1 Tax=Pseudoduganella aquatica TaxID=2660641 RepID=UPI001E5B39B9|nr:hypothetical protein [Pseudoduganella aquatica]
MNKHPDKLKAASLASRLVRASVGALAACTLLGSVLPAWASGPENNPPQRKEERARGEGQNRDQSRERDERGFGQREEAHRRILQDSTNNAEATRRVGRMTADERRDLRRQINEAGAEVYAIPPRR